LVFIIPAGVAWCIGKIFTNLSATVINHDGISLAPPPLEAAEVDGKSAFPDTEIRILYDRFVLLEIDSQEAQNGKTFTRDCLDRLCQWVLQKNSMIFPEEPSKRDLFCAQMLRFLKGIVAKIQSGEISAGEERGLLTELGKAAIQCYPTWLEGAGRIYGEVYNCSETVGVKLLRVIQQVKEAAILDFVQNETDLQWHTLSYVRKILGQELGLGNNTLDPYSAEDDPIFGKGITKWLFLEKYGSTNHLIQSVQTGIHLRKYDPCYHEFLVEIAKARKIPNPEEFVANSFFEGDDYRINFEGVNLMLRAIGILR
jgi:gamma-glutamylcyclotransferase (GGCT)/AIG2-like uncharacterized protein YtfP